MKKTLLFNILFFSFLICIKTYSQQQILVQKEWLASSGSIDTIPYSATAINSQNQVIVLGNTINAGQLNNILLTKYNQSGTILWEQQINGTDNGKDFGTALFIDTLDNIYIAGVVYSSTSNFDYLIAKYSNSGSPIWTKLFNGIANSNDIPIAIAVKNNFCYVTGSSIGNGTLTDFATLQLNITNGDINWVKTYNYSNGYEIPVGIVINPNGNVFVTGASASSLNNWDITTIEYDTLGQEINVNRSESVSNGFDKPFDIKKDYQGNIYVVGRTIAPNNT